MNKSVTVLAEITTRLSARFTGEIGSGIVKPGWVATYINDNKVWPLLTVAPIATTGTYQGKAVLDQMNFHIQVVDIEGENPDTLPERMLNHLNEVRALLFAQTKEDRHNNWNGMLNSQPQEGAEARFVEPAKGQPYAGLSIILTTTYSQNLE